MLAFPLGTTEDPMPFAGVTRNAANAHPLTP